MNGVFYRGNRARKRRIFVYFTLAVGFGFAGLITYDQDHKATLKSAAQKVCGDKFYNEVATDGDTIVFQCGDKESPLRKATVK